MSKTKSYSRVSNDSKVHNYSINVAEKDEYVLKVNLMSNTPTMANRAKNNPNPNNLPAVRKEFLSPATKKCILFVLFFISAFSFSIFAGYKGLLILFS